MPERNTENRSDVRLQRAARIVLEDFEGGVMYEARMVNYSKKGIYFESDFYLVPDRYSVEIVLLDRSHREITEAVETDARYVEDSDYVVIDFPADSFL